VKFLERLSRAWQFVRAEMDGGVQYRPDSDLWYQHLGYQTATGLRVSPESAMRVAAVFACVRVISETTASLPLRIYRRLPNGGKELATNHPLYYTLHTSPNQWQTAYEFWEMMQAHLELRGNAFARKVPSLDGPYSTLIPLHPDRVSVFRLPSGMLRYQVRYFYTARVENYEQNEIFHLRGLSQDGLVGLSTIGVGAETIGVGLAAQEFAARFFENDATPGGVMKHPKTLTDAAHKRIKADWQEYFSGMNQHGVAVLEEGMDYKQIGITNKDSQLLEARQFSRGDIASIFRIPPHKIGDLSRATFSNIEQQNIEFATDCVRPRLVRVERKINTDLIEPLKVGDGEEYYAEFDMSALLRGDLKSRFEAYSLGINAGFLTRQEARNAENLNPIEGLDQPLMPLNLAPVQNGAPILPSAPQGDESGVGAATLRLFIDAAAERVVRKEVSALRRAMGRVAQVSTFIEQAEEFYSTHAEFVVECMKVLPAVSALYVASNLRQIKSCKTSEDIERVIGEIETNSVLTLIGIATPLSLAPRKVRKQEEFETTGV